MKILMILTNPFTHDSRVYKEAKSLVNKGYNLTILAWDKTKKNPKNEKKDGINIVRSYNSKFMDLLPYSIFQLHWWWKKGYKDALKLFEKNKFNVVHCHDLSSLPIGAKLKKKFNCKLVYDAHELWAFMVKFEVPWWYYYINLEKKLIKYVDQIITVAEPHKEWFYKMGYKKVSLVRNCKDIQKKKYYPPSNKIFTIVYIGNLKNIRFIKEAVEVCQEIKNINLKIGGYGQLEDLLINYANKAPYKNIEFMGKIPIENVINKTYASDAVLCVFDPSRPNNRVGPPNKIFEAMVCGRPVIATKGIYSGNLVEKINMGITINYNKKDFREAITLLRDNKKLREKFGKNALKAAITKFNWKNQEKQLLRVYKELNIK